MDATVDQSDGYRFVYCLPFADDRLLIEDTYYSTDPALDRGRARPPDRRLCGGAGLAHRRAGAGGDRRAAGRDGRRSRRLLAGGGAGSRGSACAAASSIRPPAIRCPTRCAPRSLLAGQTRLHGAGSARRAARPRRRGCGGERGFYRLLNRMLFRAAEPAERYRVLEHFYRLDPALIARFYAGRSTAARQVAHPQRQAAGADRPRADGAAEQRHDAQRRRHRRRLRRARARHPAAVGGHRDHHHRGARQARRARLFLGEGRATSSTPARPSSPIPTACKELWALTGARHGRATSTWCRSRPSTGCPGRTGRSSIIQRRRARSTRRSPRSIRADVAGYRTLPRLFGRRLSRGL